MNHSAYFAEKKKLRTRSIDLIRYRCGAAEPAYALCGTGLARPKDSKQRQQPAPGERVSRREQRLPSKGPVRSGLVTGSGGRRTGSLSG